MKKLACVLLAMCLICGILSACGGGAGAGGKDETEPKEIVVDFGETGAKITLPGELGFEQMTSELNEYFGVGANGEWSIIVNTDEKGDYTLEEYAELTAEANEATRAIKDPDGNYYFTYKNEGYHFYTAVREGAQKYYRIAFYCFGDVWSDYADSFAQWASTIEVE